MNDDWDEELVMLYHLARDIRTPLQKKEDWDKLVEFRANWVGRKFVCEKTGVEFSIPPDVYYKAYYTFGESSIDVGDGYYARFGGWVKEIDDEV